MCYKSQMYQNKKHASFTIKYILVDHKWFQYIQQYILIQAVQSILKTIELWKYMYKFTKVLLKWVKKALIAFNLI